MKCLWNNAGHHFDGNHKEWSGIGACINLLSEGRYGSDYRCNDYDGCHQYTVNGEKCYQGRC